MSVEPSIEAEPANGTEPVIDAEPAIVVEPVASLSAALMSEVSTWAELRLVAMSGIVVIVAAPAASASLDSPATSFTVLSAPVAVLAAPVVVFADPVAVLAAPVAASGPASPMAVVTPATSVSPLPAASASALSRQRRQ